MIDDLKSRLRRIPIYAGDIRQEVERAGGIFFQQRTRLADAAPLEVNRHLVAIELDALDGSRIPAEQASDRRMILQLLQIGNRGNQRH
jgi:hypothetical protein